jgi:hypothetical protein
MIIEEQVHKFRRSSRNIAKDRVARHQGWTMFDFGLVRAQTSLAALHDQESYASCYYKERRCATRSNTGNGPGGESRGRRRCCRGGCSSWSQGGETNQVQGAINAI